MALVPTGYPDWSRRASHSDQLLFENSIGPGAAQSQAGPFPVAGVPAIAMRMAGDTNNLRFDIDWYGEDNFGTFLTTQHFHVTSTGEFHGSLPCLGPYVVIDVQGSVPAAFGSLRLWTTSRGGPHNMDADTKQILAADPVNVGAGAAQTIQGNGIWPGISQFSMRTTIATWAASLFARNYDGTTVALARWNNTAGQVINQMIATPSQQLELTFTNTSGAAGDVYVYVNGMTWQPIT